MNKEKYDKTISLESSSKMLESIDDLANQLGIDSTELIRFAIASFLGGGNKLHSSNAIHQGGKDKLLTVHTGQKLPLNLNEIAAKAVGKPIKIKEGHDNTCSSGNSARLID